MQFEALHNHQAMLLAAEAMHEALQDRQQSGQGARFKRWRLAYTLLKNPTVVKYRVHQPRVGGAGPSDGDVSEASLTIDPSSSSSEAPGVPVASVAVVVQAERSQQAGADTGGETRRQLV